MLTETSWRNFCIYAAMLAAMIGNIAVGLISENMVINELVLYVLIVIDFMDSIINLVILIRRGMISEIIGRMTPYSLIVWFAIYGFYSQELSDDIDVAVMWTTDWIVMGAWMIGFVHVMASMFIVGVAPQWRLDGSKVQAPPPGPVEQGRGGVHGGRGQTGKVGWISVAVGIVGPASCAGRQSSLEWQRELLSQPWVKGPGEAVWILEIAMDRFETLCILCGLWVIGRAVTCIVKRPPSIGSWVTIWLWLAATMWLHEFYVERWRPDDPVLEWRYLIYYTTTVTLMAVGTLIAPIEGLRAIGVLAWLRGKRVYGASLRRRTFRRPEVPDR